MTVALIVVALAAISLIVFPRRTRPNIDDRGTVPLQPQARMHRWRQCSDAQEGTETATALARAAKGANAKALLLLRASNRAKRPQSIQKGYVVPLQVGERFGDASKAPKLRVVQVEPLRSIRTAFVPKADVPVIVKRPRLSLAR
jgi:hypothetical protein